VLNDPYQLRGIKSHEIILIKKTKKGDNKKIKAKDNFGNEVSLNISFTASISGCNKPKKPI
jgi:hypothetical protein